MLYIKLFIEREKNIGQSAPECPFNIIIKVFYWPVLLQETAMPVPQIQYDG